MNHTGQRMRSRISKTLAIGILVGVVCVGAVVWALASKSGSTELTAGNPQSQATDYAKALAGAPPALARLYVNGDDLIDGGADELHAQLAQLEGYPVVVNVWASWCGPCRLEFPYLQKVAAARGDEVAFIGVDAFDDPAAARTFLDQLPLPYPSVSDPDEEVKKELRLRGYPGTAFYDSVGKLTYVKQGPYSSAAELDADIDKYAS